VERNIKLHAVVHSAQGQVKEAVPETAVDIAGDFAELVEAIAVIVTGPDATGRH